MNNKFLSENKNSFAAIILTVVTYLLIFINASFVWVIPTIIAARKLIRAKKEKENKDFIFWAYFIVYSPLLVWILGSFMFVVNILNNGV